ncbi:MAG: hypothetical protein CVV05_09575 [Gammaproteobacteria bacterium HGW-Gammaproteobacteria-1]|jgi:hypothetical protein|nr:MAG: hypothetical protein CVV05_09575 [Gammaproteobacteria bacterium HGW-Gammaproteobacteria-1]
MTVQTPDANSVGSLVEMAAQRLLSGASTGEPQDSVLFTGVWHDAYPAILIRDPILPDSTKVHMLYLLQEARSQPYGVTPLPSIEMTARELGKSTTTIVRDRAILRMTRWISQCRQVRDAQGRFRGAVHALHSEPASLAQVTQLDAGYMALLEQAATGHFDRIARRVAHAVLAAIDDDIHRGHDPLEPVDPIAQRMEAIQSAKAGAGRFFAGVITERKSRLQDLKSAEPVSNLETRGPEPVSKFETGELEPTSKFETGPESGSYYTVITPIADNITQDSCAGAERDNTVGTPLADSKTQDSGAEVGVASGGDTAAILETTSGKVESRRTRSIFSPKHLQKAENPPKLEAGGPCSSSSDLCIQEKTTTTGNPVACDAVPLLHWPPDFSDNLKRLVLRALKDHLPERPEDHQDVVNALAQRLRNKSDPVRNIVGYTAKLCGTVKSGEFCPVQPPLPPGSHVPADSTVRISTLRGEIRALERLVHAAPRTAPNRSALEAQLAQRRSQLRELEEPKRH